MSNYSKIVGSHHLECLVEAAAVLPEEVDYDTMSLYDAYQDLHEQVNDFIRTIRECRNWEQADRKHEDDVRIEVEPGKSFSVWYKDREVLKYIGADTNTALPRFRMSEVTEDGFQFMFGSGYWQLVDEDSPASTPIVYGEGTPQHEQWKVDCAAADARKLAETSSQ
jgi:hypothetical protein